MSHARSFNDVSLDFAEPFCEEDDKDASGEESLSQIKFSDYDDAASGEDVDSAATGVEE